MNLKVFFTTRAAVPMIDPDDEPLRVALEERGVEVQPAVWTDPNVDWSAADLCLIRSTWDYHRHLQEFIAWAERVDAVTRLWNGLDLVRWNTDKHYLRDLEQAGVPAVTTVWLPRGEPADFSAILEEHGWDEVVIKPTVSADSFGTMRLDRATAREAQIRLDSLLRIDDIMLQPFLAPVVERGERSLIFIAEELTHALRRGDVFGRMQRAQELIEPTPEEVALARRALAEVTRPYLYARVDLISPADEPPILMELELVEPSLFLPLAPQAAERLAERIMEIIG